MWFGHVCDWRKKKNETITKRDMKQKCKEGTVQGDQG